ncbi:MAG: radical SAM protein [Lachnospiraceae bacterium]|nr:radical SAM protein [Lachnospiraceae bacterium]MCI1655938.1 radical SAM protein [Lachnospiraceae bacterium]MCI2194420.1 radical SAM protein [Lachnospiraceae bacterium]
MNKATRYTTGPYQLSLDITNRCNLRCLHCYNSSGENCVMNNELSDKEVRKFVDSLLPMKLLNLCFCGGETLLRKELIYECVRILSNGGIRTALVSNGTLATEEVIHNLYVAGLKSIQFSIDGCCEETHDRLRNKKGVFEKVIKALNIVRNYDMEISISFAPTSFNVNELEMLHAYLESLSYENKAELRLQPLMPLGRGNKNKNDICPSEEQYRKLVNTVGKINQRNPKIRVVWGDPIDHLIRFWEY